MICKNISRNQLIEEVAKRCDYYKEDVQVMYDALTATIIDHLMEADEQCNISINLCTGIMLKSNYVEGREHRLPTGEIMTVEPGLKFRGHFSKEWKTQRNAEYRATAKCLQRWETTKKKQGEKRKNEK